MRRSLVLAALTTVPVLLSGPADAATTPYTGCATGWQLVPVFVPVLAAADNVNHDGLICTRNTAKGSLFVDNTSAAVSSS